VQVMWRLALELASGMRKRAKANKFSKAKRQQLMKAGMKLIAGGKRRLDAADDHKKALITEQDICRLGPGRPAVRRLVVLDRLAALGKTALDLEKMTTVQLEQMLYELESGEPG